MKKEKKLDRTSQEKPNSISGEVEELSEQDLDQVTGGAFKPESRSDKHKGRVNPIPGGWDLKTNKKL